MDGPALKLALATVLPKELADDLVDQFLEIRTDVATKTLGRGSAGKFVESTVQALQALEQNGSYDAKPDVDRYLRGLESRASTLPDGLRICCARLAHAMYALRSKRNIVHKGDVDPSLYDLQMLYAGAQWTLAELLALSPGISGEEASRLVAQVQLPVGGLVEVLGDRHLVHGDLTVPEEALVLLMNHYPTPITVAEVRNSMDRRSPGSVDNALRDLWKGKLVHRPATGQVILTERGMREAIKVAQAHAA